MNVFFLYTHIYCFFSCHRTTRVEKNEKNGEKPPGKKMIPNVVSGVSPPNPLSNPAGPFNLPPPPPPKAHGFAAASNKKSVVCNGTKTNVINGRRLLQFIPCTANNPSAYRTRSKVESHPPNRVGLGRTERGHKNPPLFVKSSSRKHTVHAARLN